MTEIRLNFPLLFGMWWLPPMAAVYGVWGKPHGIVAALALLLFGLVLP